jgi:NAD(P)-dependent dehydrogenase (short-subunit alcohol dehydrogenase family)
MAATLEGKVALVTGGTGGIGLCVCRSLAKLGASIAVVDLSLEKCQEVAASLPTKSAGFAINIADDAAVKVGIEELLGTFPDGVDILVNIAGASSSRQ